LSGKAETISGLRSLLEDLLAPRVRGLEVEVASLGERCKELASGIRENREAHQALLANLSEQLGVINSRLGRLEGRSDGLKSELTAVLQIEILKAAQRFQPLPPVKTDGLLPPSDILPE
jgi:chromosome segregation ATPase